MSSFPSEIASFPFYKTFYDILMAAVNANKAAQLSYIQNLAQIAFKKNANASQGDLNLSSLSGELNYVEFKGKLQALIPNPAYNPKDPTANPATIPQTIDKQVRVPLIAIVDVRPMAIDKVTADLSIKLKQEIQQVDKSSLKFDEALDVGIDLGFLTAKSHTELSYQSESSLTQGTTREYNLQVHMEASTQPLNAPLKNIIDYLIRNEA